MNELKAAVDLAQWDINDAAIGFHKIRGCIVSHKQVLFCKVDVDFFCRGVQYDF